MMNSKYLVGECELDCKLMSLNYQQNTIKLSSKVYQLLLLFIENRDNIVSRQQAIDTIWLGNEGVGKKGFTNAIWVIRKTFKELGIQDEVFTTLPKLGYQLTLPVTQHQSAVTAHSQQRKMLVIILPLLLIATLVALVVYLKPPQAITPPTSVAPTAFVKPTKTKVTNYEGVEEHIAVSHDGKRLAMQWRTDTLTGKLYIKNLTQTDSPLTLISFENNEEASPAWSSADDKLAYVRIAKGGECQVRVKNLIDNTDALVASDCFYMPYKRVVAWSSHDDNSLVYSKQYGDNVSLVTHDLTTGISQQITFPQRNEIDYAPKWLPNDNQLAFIRESGTSTLASLVIQGLDGTTQQLISNNASIVDFDYSATDNLFYINNVDGANAIISRIYADGTPLPPLQHVGLPSSITLSDINKTLYVTEHISKEYIAQQSYDEKQTLRRISSSSRDMYARYSVTNDDILFMSNRSKLWSVWKNNRVSSKNLTKNLGNVTVPAISPVNTDFAVNINVDGRSTLFLGDINSETFSTIDINGLEADNLSWSKDGEYLYFKGSTKALTAIYKLHVKSGELQQIIQNNGVYSVEGERDSVIYLSKFNENGIWRFDVETSELTQITDKLAKFDFGSFYYEQGYIYYLSREHQLDTVERIAVTADANVDIIATYPANSVRKFFGLSAADRHSFLVTLKVANEADVFGYALSANTENVR